MTSLESAAARLVADRVSQGLPALVTDPVTMSRLAAILGGGDEGTHTGGISPVTSTISLPEVASGGRSRRR